MSETKEVSKATEIEEEETKRSKLLAYPEICAVTNEDSTGYDIDIFLPGVEKDTIKLRANEEFIYIRGESDNVRYSGYYTLCCPIDTEKVDATYKEGLLRLKTVFKEPEMHTISVKVR